MALKPPVIAIGQVIALGVQEQEARQIFGSGNQIPWHQLASVDINLGLSVLTPQYLRPIQAEFLREAEGLKGDERKEFESKLETTAGMQELIYGGASSFCPKDEWFSQRLLHFVAVSLLLKMAQEAWAEAAGLILPDVLQ